MFSEESSVITPPHSRHFKLNGVVNRLTRRAASAPQSQLGTEAEGEFSQCDKLVRNEEEDECEIENELIDTKPCACNSLG